MKKNILLITFLFLYINTYSQQNINYINNVVILKIKKDIKSDDIFEFFFSKLKKNFTDINILSITPIFPNISRESSNDKLGVDLSRIYKINYSPAYDPHSIADILMNTGTVEYAEPYYIPDLLYIPNDPFNNNQYYLNLIKAYEAWDIEIGDTSIVIGIVDTGFDFTHPDLVHSVAYNYNDTIDDIDNDNDGYIDNYRGWDYGEMDNDPTYMANAHGVHVSGIAGAVTDNGFGMSSVGFNCKILPIKAMNDNGQMVGAYEGIIYAVEHGCDVINCSWGSPYFAGHFPLEVIKYCTLIKNAIIVAAAGNQNDEIRYYPAAFPNVVGVSATNHLDHKWQNSSYYYDIDISAPGQNIFSTWPNAGFISSSGTSMSAPIVSAASALVWSHYPQLNNLDIIEVLRTTADIIDTIPENVFYANKLGTGRLNVYRALTDTFLPSIRLVDYSINSNNITINDTFAINFTIQSFLKNSYNVKINLKSLNSDLHLIDSIFTFDSLIHNEPLQLVARFYIDDTAIDPTTFVVLAYLHNNSFSNVDPIYINYTPNILDLKNDKIKVSFTNNGRIGYYDGRYYLYGNGIKYQNSAPLSSVVGIIAGTAEGKISDNVYGINNELKNDFKVKSEIYTYTNDVNYTQEIVCQYNDSMSFLPIGINIIQSAYCFTQGIDQDFFIITYSLKNNTLDDIDNLYFGIYADWDIMNSGNKVEKDHSIRGAITFDIDSNYFAGIGLLSDLAYGVYALDNDGDVGSINIYDGFTDAEKKICLTTERSMAGIQNYGNDVSVLVKTGPLTIPFDDSLIISFAFVFSKNYYQLISNYQKALNIFNDINNHYTLLPSPIIYPNPANEVINIEFYDNNATMSIYDERGALVLSKKLIDNIEKISIKDLSPGIYFIKIKTENQEWEMKLSIQ